MKNIALGILLIVAIAFGGLYLQQTRKAEAARAALAALQQQQEAARAIAEQQAAALSNRLEIVESQTAVKAGEAARLQRLLTNPAPVIAASTNAKPSNPLARMFSDPAMKEMVLKQARATFDRTFDKSYGKLLAELNLTPEQSAALKDLIWSKRTASQDLGFSVFSEDMDPAKRAELVQQAKANKDAADAQIRQLLGDDSFAQYQTYEKSQPDRTAVSNFQRDLEGGAAALSGDQQQQLVQALSEERQNFKFTTDYTDEARYGDPATFFSEDKLNQYFQEQDQLNQKYLARAQAILSPDQFEAFQKFLATQLENRKTGMQMAAKMFAQPPPHN